MANPRWIGAAGAVAQVITAQITAFDAATTYTITAGSGRAVSVVGVTSVNATATALQVALAASTFPEFTEVTWTVNTDTVTGTSKVAGKPSTYTSSDTGGTGTIGAVATSTAATGPNHWDNALNWDTGSVPVDADNVYLDNSSVDILYGLDQSAVTPASLTIAASYTGFIGLAEINTGSSASYHEYRDQYLKLGDAADATPLVVSIGEGPGSGSRRIKLNTNACQTTGTVSSTGTGAETDLEALLWKGTHASNAWTILKGSVGMAVYGAEAATVATLNVGYVTGQSSDAKVRLGSGVTLTTLNQNGGEVQLNSALTTVTKNGGTLTIRGTGAITTLTENNGQTNHYGTGTVTTLSVGTTGAITFDGAVAAITVTNTDLYKGARLTDSNKRVTWTNGIDLNNCGLDEVSLNVGKHVRLTRGSPA